MKRLDNGFPTIISFSSAPLLKVFEKEVTPPGINAGGPIDTTTMRNTAWRTQSPKSLKTLSQASFTAAYATDVYRDIVGQIGLKQQITISFPDDSSLTFWGWLDSFAPTGITEGNQPTATVTIQPSNTDANDNEVSPDYNTASSNV